MSKSRQALEPGVGILKRWYGFPPIIFVEAELMSSFQAPIRSPSAESILRRLEWTVIRRLDGLLHGDYQTLFRGFGLDLADLREYQYHDDVRYIDWNVTARLQTPYVQGLQRRPRSDRVVSARFKPVRGFRLSGEETLGIDRIRHRAGAAFDPSRQSRRRACFMATASTP